MSPRLTATERLERMLAIVPFVASHPEGVAIDEVSERFELGRDELLSCLDTVFMVGVHPYTPDALVEVLVDADTVSIRMSEWFRRPLQLTNDQRLALLVARRTFKSVPGADDDGPLMRALDKVAGAIDDAPSTLALEFDAGNDSDIERLRGAIASPRVVSFDYHSFGRNSHDRRTVEPWRLQIDGGHWYLEGRCRDAADRRVFRVDRIDGVDVTHESSTIPSELPPFEAFPASAIERTITLDLEPSARWVASQYPSISAVDSEEGRVRIVLPVANVPWLERLLLRLGPDALIVEADEELATVGVLAARRLLDRYDH